MQKIRTLSLEESQKLCQELLVLAEKSDGHGVDHGIDKKTNAIKVLDAFLYQEGDITEGWQQILSQLAETKIKIWRGKELKREEISAIDIPFQAIENPGFNTYTGNTAEELAESRSLTAKADAIRLAKSQAPKFNC